VIVIEFKQTKGLTLKHLVILAFVISLRAGVFYPVYLLPDGEVDCAEFPSDYPRKRAFDEVKSALADVVGDCSIHSPFSRFEVAQVSSKEFLRLAFRWPKE
jgi:hypothetical protein